MRFYGVVFGSSSEKIKEKAKIRLREYAYECDGPLAAMNKYLHQNMVSTIGFLAYNEEQSCRIQAVFFYDESKHSFDNAYNYILNMLADVFGIKTIKEEPYEITSQQFYESFIEAKRRSFNISYRILDMAKLRYYEELDKEINPRKKFDFNEKIISIKNTGKISLYDKSLIHEISNIEAHTNTSELNDNIVHYVISSRSVEATTDMTETLMKSLYKANRIKTRRMCCISNIDKDFYKADNYIEELIENNFGGVIVIDLSERFGENPINYSLTAQYIVKLVKKYRNKCLFLFTYNMDKPGFSYNVLPYLKNLILPVMLREGSGNRKAAIAYLKKLIKASEYSQYANQAEEFMKNYHGDTFSQTDVLMAYERFGTWCINKNIIKAYDYDINDEFLLDRDENGPSAQEKLDSLIGLKCVKDQIKSILATHCVEKERKKYRKKANKPSTLHMIFAGNPGSAKTTVARLFAGIAKEKGLLKSGAFIEQSGVVFNDPMMGPARVMASFKAAKGGVLFIDEAYAISYDSSVTVLLQEMENHRDEVIVILAGYDNRMKDFLYLNEGLKSRIPHWVNFPDYSTEELTEIFRSMIDEYDFKATDDAIREAHYIFDKARLLEDFGNGRYVRNLLERAIQNQSLRLSESDKDISDMNKKDLFTLIREDISASDEQHDNKREADDAMDEQHDERRETGAAMKELQDMIGLSSVKSVISKVVAGAKINKYCTEKGIRRDKASLHMVFTGNPGTAKTTVARLLGEIMKDEQLLSSGIFVEAGRADLVGEYMGQTAPKVKNMFRKAQGGVLFIDEAYSLCDGDRSSFGDEAINTIVQEMENHREETVVIFAGYPHEMQKFLDRNPGLSSRIAFRVEFDDYSTDELCEITKLMLTKKEMSITDTALSKLKASYDVARKSSDYGNGRFVRKLLEEAEMNLAQRIYGMDESEIDIQLLTTIEECDIPESSSQKSNSKKIPLGFHAT